LDLLSTGRWTGFSSGMIFSGHNSELRLFKDSALLCNMDEFRVPILLIHHPQKPLQQRPKQDMILRNSYILTLVKNKVPKGKHFKENCLFQY
jgi:hypothetical protein